MCLSGTVFAPGVLEVAVQYISAHYGALQALQLDATWAALVDTVYNNPHYTGAAAPQAYAES